MSGARIVIFGLIISAVVGAAPTSVVAQTTVPTDAQRRECERNGGYWVTAVGYCKVGA